MASKASATSSVIERWPGMATASQRTEATRLVCAAVHAHPLLRDRILRAAFHERHRGLGDAGDVDVPRVLDEAMRAHLHDGFRDSLLAAIAIVLVAVVLSRAQGLGVALLECALLVAAYAVVLWHMARRRRVVLGSFSRGRFRARAEASDEARSADARVAREVCVYGGFTPFAGAGFHLLGWSFAVNTDRPPADHVKLTPQPFTADELHDAIRESLLRTEIENLTIGDRWFAQGKDAARVDARLVPDPARGPVGALPPEVAADLARRSPEGIRRYACYQVRSWDGEVVLSLFLRCRLLGSSLFVEASYWILPPIAEEFRTVDRTPDRSSLRSYMRYMVAQALATPILLAGAIPRSIGHLTAPLRRWLDRRRIRIAIVDDPEFDHGAPTTIRQLATANEYRRYFQKLDGEMSLKVMERQILDAIVEFLEARGIDTSDLRERRTSILNQGVMVTGGAIHAEAVVGGREGRATVNGPRSKIGRVASAARAAARAG